MTYGDYPDLKGVKKILVVKLRQLGDVLLTGPVFKVLKNRFPEAKVDAYVYTESFPLLEGCGLLGYDRNWKKLGIFKRLKKEFALWAKIRKERYDLVINLTEGDRGAFAARISGAKIRVGFTPKGRWQKKLYTHVVKHCLGLRHTVERNLDAIRRIGIFPTWEERELSLEVPDWEKVPQGPYVVIHPTSRWRFKCWPAEKMREIAKKLIERGVKVVVTAGPGEDVEAIVKDLPVLNFCGALELKELAALIRSSACLLCVDSLPFHIASALKKPVVALFGPTSEITWGPWRNPEAVVLTENFSCRPCYQDGCGGSKKSDCLEQISVERVWSVLEAKIFPKIGAARLGILDETFGCSR